MIIFLDVLFAEVFCQASRTRKARREAGRVMERRGFTTRFQAPLDAKARPRVAAAHRLAVSR
ncbi:hypothetical protein [Pelomonas cellulosilytica]|uniref:Uncharacterized protein n=1 Tax=Pelomonas cellulosilytica TaxID=2906762 RepID=A0ABS8XQX1_9BURK|nr:hypothetical protein [Pelomonas sp. P8]MCE4552996.1 hypothetical protein [Pelomonas sp. P8]